MTTLSQLEHKIESLSEKVKNLNYKFKDEDLEREGNETISEISSLLENYLDLATRDSENISPTENNDFND
jgi:hypothetical protein